MFTYIYIYIYIYGPGLLSLKRGAQGGTQKYGGITNWVWGLGPGPVWPGLARYCSDQLGSARLAQFGSLGSARRGSALHPKVVILRRRDGIHQENIAFHVDETRLDSLNMHFAGTRSSKESAVVEMRWFRIDRTATYRMHLHSFPVPSASSTA